MRGVDWGNAEIVATERGLRQRKVLEGMESLQQKHRGMRVFNNFDPVVSTRGNCVLNEKKRVHNERKTHKSDICERLTKK